jgi:predicted dehydrogenase/aryl-alcohol dehydrogenase-like predicted oxidoreductase
MADRLRWGILAPGGIAKQFARGVAHSKTGTLVAVGSRTREKAEAFGNEFNVPRRHGSYEALLADAEVDAVYIATPHPMHAEWVLKAAEAGKHILCEKPISMNHAEAMAMVEAARRHDVFLMEAFMYRCHPQTLRLAQLVREGAVGEVRVIKATFSFHAGFNAESRLFKNDLAGGGILDVGCYATSAARLIAGAALGRDFAEPLEVKGCGHLGQTGVDEWAVASLKFPGEIVAQVATGVSVNQANTIEVYGSEGSIVVPWPWIPGREGGASKIILHKKGQEKPEEITVETGDWLYSLEADAVAANLARRQAAPPAMTWADTLGNMAALDRWRESIGLVYEMEKPAHARQRQPLIGRPVTRRADAPMKYGRIAGLEKDISRLVMGVDNQTAVTHGNVMFDDWFERGGNAFDSAFIYGGGRCEKTLGHWVSTRGVRKDVVLLDKGAHTPDCTPEKLTSQLLVSLQRLGTDYLDIYMMHRDNEAVPVGEFIDVLNEHAGAGRIRIFGGSNWTVARVEAANAYAKAHGLQGFSAVSNNFSLARMVNAVWDGCIQASGPEDRAWLTRTQLPLMPWSSQARGFFTRAAPDFTDDAELVRCWYADDNFRRLERARELAAKRGVQPIQIALAYVLRQPFPTFPLIGPRTIDETRSSIAALAVDLTPNDLAWLNLERD